MSAEPSDRNMWRGVKVAAFVTLLGPLIGALALLALGMARVVFANGTGPLPSIDAASMISVALWFSVFGYVFGGLPALISGVVLGIRAAKGHTSGVLLTLGIVTVALLITAIVFRVVPLRDEPAGSASALVILLAPLAIVSAWVCRWFMIKIRLLPSI